MKIARTSFLLGFIVATSSVLPAADTLSTTQGLACIPVPFTRVVLQDNFWRPRQETNRVISIPHSLEMLRKAREKREAELAPTGKRISHSGPFLIDSDLYKAMEAVSYSLASVPDAELEKKLDGLIAHLEAAQRPDGYINTWYLENADYSPWANLRDQHELYCAGHLFEAGVAHHAATGKKSLLTVATRFADLIDATFGDAPGKRPGYCGHPEIELALIKLANATGEKRYFELARHFMERRGEKFFAKEHSTPPDKYDGRYWQDSVRMRDNRSIGGHAVRAVYMMCGFTDLAAATRDKGIIRMLDRVWQNTTGCNMYVTGGIGSSAANEGFTFDYDLPNQTAYQETCASVAMVMWGHRMNLLHGDSRYADAMERALYNGVLAGVSLDGRKFFYVNPLASQGTHHRQDWYGCACCPPNVTRTLAQLGGYAYLTSPGAVWVNLYVQGTVEAQLDGKSIRLGVRTDYPWDGRVSITPDVDEGTSFQLRLRLPAWCRDASLELNGVVQKDVPRDKGYAVIDRTWSKGDQVTLNMSMPVMRVSADARVKENAGRLAIQRGPLVYCLEDADHETSVSTIAVPASAQFEIRKHPELLGGVVALATTGEASGQSRNHETGLYFEKGPGRSVPVTAVPYYAWDNRQAGEMAVWLPTEAVPPVWGRVAGGPKVAMSFVSANCTPDAITDGREPASSGEQSGANCHWWPRQGTEEWVSYAWPELRTFRSARVYWFDDTGRGDCRTPQSWRLEYDNGSGWKPVEGVAEYPVKKDGWCDVEFPPIQAKQVRLAVQLPPGFAAGVHEWELE